MKCYSRCKQSFLIHQLLYYACKLKWWSFIESIKELFVVVFGRKLGYINFISILEKRVENTIISSPRSFSFLFLLILIRMAACFGNISKKFAGFVSITCEKFAIFREKTAHLSYFQDAKCRVNSP